MQSPVGSEGSEFGTQSPVGSEGSKSLSLGGKVLLDPSDPKFELGTQGPVGSE